jgi:predicted O-methyltransferase YrrM
MIEKIKTIAWFLRKPQYIPQIFQILKRKKNEKLENTREKATLWCQSIVIPQQEALEIIFGKGLKIDEIELLYPQYFKYAKEESTKCPVEMGGEGAINFIYTVTKILNPKKILETGVAYGWSSLAILLAIKDSSEAKLISNDMPYIKMNNDDYVGIIIHKKLKDNWVLQRQADVKGIPLAIKKFNNSIDMCHYDSDKSYTGRMWSSPMIWNAIRKGGLFISDDINDNIAFKHFCESVEKTPIVIKHNDKFVGILKK